MMACTSCRPTTAARARAPGAQIVVEAGRHVHPPLAAPPPPLRRPLRPSPPPPAPHCAPPRCAPPAPRPDRPQPRPPRPGPPPRARRRRRPAHPGAPHQDRVHAGGAGQAGPPPSAGWQDDGRRARCVGLRLRGRVGAFSLSGAGTRRDGAARPGRHRGRGAVVGTAATGPTRSGHGPDPGRGGLGGQAVARVAGSRQAPVAHRSPWSPPPHPPPPPGPPPISPPPTLTLPLTLTLTLTLTLMCRARCPWSPTARASRSTARPCRLARARSTLASPAPTASTRSTSSSTRAASCPPSSLASSSRSSRCTWRARWCPTTTS